MVGQTKSDNIDHKLNAVELSADPKLAAKSYPDTEVFIVCKTVCKIVCFTIGGRTFSNNVRYFRVPEIKKLQRFPNSMGGHG